MYFINKVDPVLLIQCGLSNIDSFTDIIFTQSIRTP